MSGMTTPTAKMHLEKLVVEIKMRFDGNLPENEDIVNYLSTWRANLMRTNMGIASIGWDIQEEMYQYNVRVVMLLSEQFTTVSETFEIPRVDPGEVETGTTILSGPAS